jgi:exo-1,4-beta-D-glucosaminidase
MSQRKLSKWKIQSSMSVKSGGDVLSVGCAETESWYKASVPSTILGALVENGVFQDLYRDKNLLDIDTSQFGVPWWYLCEFDLTDEEVEKNVILCLDGINYQGNIWLNGKLIADNSIVIGTYRRHEFELLGAVSCGRNILAIEVIPPVPGDFAIGFVDWNPKPPDGNMGIFRDVTLSFYENVAIKYPNVVSKLDLDGFGEAKLTVHSILKNYTSSHIDGILTGLIDSTSFSMRVNLEPYQEKSLIFKPDDFESLVIQHPRVWEPNNIGLPHLYDLELSFECNDRICDRTGITFGIREVSDYLTEDGHRGYIINGHKTLIKGAGWTDDLFLNDTYESIETQVQYARDMNLNCIRLEGFWGKSQEIYDLCDRYGILLMVGWSCHWEHECHLGVPVDRLYGGVHTPKAIDLIAESWKDQLLQLRHHPSIFVWTVASDIVPHPDLENRYIDIFNEYDTSRPYLNSTGGVGSEQSIITNDLIESTISGSSGVKMLGPYDHTPPHYWYTNKNLGGAYGFNTETCPGANVPPLESLKKMFSPENLWPINETWDFHCGLYEFATLGRYKEALDQRYAPSSSVKEFAAKSQLMNYELMRPMFEAFQCNKGTATGVIQWMLNSAFPSLYWQLYDTYLTPNGAYYAVKKRCEPLHALYNYGENSVFIVNDFHTQKNVQISIRLFDIKSCERFSKVLNILAPPDSSTFVMKLPEDCVLGSTYFLDLRLAESGGEAIGSNFYWLSDKKDVLDYDAKVGDFGFYTPSKEFADFTSLANLPFPRIDATESYIEDSEDRIYTVSLVNDNQEIAFFLVLDLVEKNKRETLTPVFWSDNYFSLMPFESRTITGKVKKSQLSQGQYEVRIQGWNKNEDS